MLAKFNQSNSPVTKTLGNSFHRHKCYCACGWLLGVVAGWAFNTQGRYCTGKLICFADLIAKVRRIRKYNKLKIFIRSWRIQKLPYSIKSHAFCFEMRGADTSIKVKSLLLTYNVWTSCTSTNLQCTEQWRRVFKCLQFLNCQTALVF